MSILVVCYVNLAISLVVSHFSNRREPPETMDKFKASACVEWTVNVATRPLRLMGGYYGGHFTHIALNYETLIPVVWAEICWQEHRDANELNCFLDCQSGLTHNRRQLSLVIKRWAGKQVNFRCSFRPSPLSSRRSTGWTRRFYEFSFNKLCNWCESFAGWNVRRRQQVAGAHKRWGLLFKCRGRFTIWAKPNQQVATVFWASSWPARCVTARNINSSCCAGYPRLACINNRASKR